MVHSADTEMQISFDFNPRNIAPRISGDGHLLGLICYISTTTL